MLNPLDETPAGGEATGKCTFQFWVDRVESFYCKLDQCKWSFSDSAGESWSATCLAEQCGSYCRRQWHKVHLREARLFLRPRPVPLRAGRQR